MAATTVTAEGELIAIDSINDPVSFMSCKQLLKKGIRTGRDEATSTENLKDLVSSTPKK